MKSVTRLAGLLLVSFLASCQNHVIGQNIALKKSYTLSVKPDYPYTAPATDNFSLTDGVYSSTLGTFWKSKTTVGWKKGKKIFVEIDLLKDAGFNEIVYSTGRSDKGGVYFPANVFAFTSDDKSTYKYLGDIVSDPANTAGDYLVRKFSLKDLNASGRYVLLYIVPQGLFTFCDEVEVIAGGSGKAATKSLMTIPRAGIDKMVDSLMNINSSKQVAIRALSAMGGDKNANVNARSADNSSVDELQAKVYTSRSAKLKGSFSTSVVIENINVWDNIRGSYLPKKNESVLQKVIVPVNGTQYGAFTLTNLFTTETNFDFNISGGDNSSSVEIYGVPFITAGLQYQQIPDPLVDTKQGVKLKPGETRVVLYKVSGLKRGTSDFNVKITGNKSETNLKLSVNTLNTDFTSSFSLNTINWAYLNYPLFSNKKAAAVKDLSDHHINAMVVPPAITGAVNNQDFTALNDYVAALKGTRTIILYCNFLSSGNVKFSKQAGFMSDSWKNAFISWYGKVSDICRKNGFSAQNVYIYPYDEVATKDLGDFLSFLKWSKQKISGLKIYATLGSNTLRTSNNVQSILPYVDIAQVSAIKEGMNLDFKDRQSWVYSATGNAEMLSPYSYYRLMSWNAFINDFTGVGFWSYADYSNDPDSKANSFNKSTVSYSVIYTSPSTGIQSSRRWEAFSLGVEDYELLLKYSRKFGIEKTKSLAKSVVGQPQDVTKADVIRNQIINALQ